MVLAPMHKQQKNAKGMVSQAACKQHHYKLEPAAFAERHAIEPNLKG
jgi:hypothetical protein